MASYQYALLAEYELYQFCGYINFLRTLPAYESYIITLYEGMCEEQKPYLTRRGQCKRYFWRPLWWDNLAGSCHNSFLENVRLQYVYIKNEQARRVKQAELRAEKEELRAKQEQDALEVSRQKHEAEQAELEQHIAQENAQKEYIRKLKTLPEYRVEKQSIYEQSLSEKQKEVLQHLHKNREYMNDCTETYNQILSKGDVSEQEAQRLQQRIEAIAQTLEENRAFEPIKYPLSRQVSDLLHESCIESNAFKEHDNTVLIDSIEGREIYLDGLPIQHCIQQEINAVLNKVADLRYTLRSGIRNSQLLRLFTNSVGKMSYVAVESAKEGRVPFAMEVSDFCVHVSDQFEKGFWEGLCCLEEECFDVVHKALDSVVSAAKSDWCAGTKGKTGYSIAIGNAFFESCEEVVGLMDSVKAFNKKGNQAFLYGKDNLGETCIALKNKTLGVVDVGKQTFFYVKDNPKEAYAVLKNEALKLKGHGSSFVGNTYSSVADGVTNTTGPEKMHFVAKNVFQTLAWKKALGAVGMLGKSPRHAVCSAITESERQAGVMLFAEKYGLRVQEIPRCCLKNAPTSITREAVGMAAANQIVAHEGRQLLALANNGAVAQSSQFLTQLPRTAVLKAAAEAALSTNIFGGVAGAATSTAISANANAALVAGVVEKTLATDMAHAVTAAGINVAVSATNAVTR